MATTYSVIQSQTLGSTSTIISFANIPSIYTDLRLIFTAVPLNGTGINVYLQFNNDGNYNYSSTWMYTNGSSVGKNRQLNTNTLYTNINYTSGGSSFTQSIDFMSYANTSIYKTILIRDGGAPAGSGLSTGLWRSTAAITNIDVVRGTGNNSFQPGSVFTLYGIASA
jgi:hypothetical protein